MHDLPWQSLALNPLAAFGILLALGVLGGQIAVRVAKLPGITGYILSGLIIGPSGLKLLDQQLIDEAGLFIQLALGLALFDMGRRVDLRWLRREKALFATALLSGVITFLGLLALLTFSGFPMAPASLLAAIGIATSPVVLLELVRESRAEGQVTERLMACTGLNNLLSLTVFTLALSFTHFSAGHGVESFILLPGWLLLGSVLLGLVAGLLAIRLNVWLGGGKREAQTVLMFGLIALVVGLSAMLKLLPALAILIFGLATRNLERGYAVAEPSLSSRSSFFFVAFFVAAGAQLMPLPLAALWPSAVGFVLVRSLLAAGSWWVAARSNGLPPRHGALLGLGLLPMSGSAVMLMTMGALTLSAGAAEFSGFLLSVLCLTELLGPIVTRFALRCAQETRD
ncbi:cation:proton antiporter [Pseudogulbenkiania ferrooxidans]|uniref:Sodium/hydrogen exchanger n=1 Tax=Pseudogulbenkiania ferrooxidans 2002 TaxID=279714 RepID=B9Z2Q5_9NEIS|nr:cation:proton antiporter [Pseudogulbenkiania ferrooxidans]EEG08858.1 sodium/hydrogen exchanger [Pseudogulbenkiania ferrooxidans 2002]